MARLFLIVGLLSAFLAVALGAFGAHALKARVPQDMLTVFETGVRYQMYHALGLIALAIVLSQWNITGLALTGWLFIGGTLLFSGSLYALSLTGLRWLGALTPFGGVMYLAGWLWFAWCVVKSSSR